MPKIGQFGFGVEGLRLVVEGEKSHSPDEGGHDDGKDGGEFHAQTVECAKKRSWAGRAAGEM